MEESIDNSDLKKESDNQGLGKVLFNNFLEILPSSYITYDGESRVSLLSLRTYCVNSFPACLVFCSFSVRLGWDTVGPALAAISFLPPF